MTFGHIVLEGYCSAFDFSEKRTPCTEHKLGKPSHYCLGSGSDDVCQYFSWCRATDYVVMTDEHGHELNCVTIDELNREAVNEYINEMRKIASN